MKQKNKSSDEGNVNKCHNNYDYDEKGSAGIRIRRQVAKVSNVFRYKPNQNG